MRVFCRRDFLLQDSRVGARARWYATCRVVSVPCCSLCPAMARLATSLTVSAGELFSCRIRQRSAGEFFSCSASRIPAGEFFSCRPTPLSSTPPLGDGAGFVALGQCPGHSRIFTRTGSDPPAPEPPLETVTQAAPASVSRPREAPPRPLALHAQSRDADSACLDSCGRPRPSSHRSRTRPFPPPPTPAPPIDPGTFDFAHARKSPMRGLLARSPGLFAPLPHPPIGRRGASDPSTAPRLHVGGPLRFERRPQTRNRIRTHL